MKRLKKTLSVLLITLMAVLAVSEITFSDKAYAAGSVVIDGKDGWYFYSGDSTIADYLGTNLYSPEQLEVLRQRLLFTKNTLEAQGIEFIVCLAPNKEHIYPEYMPDSFGPLTPYTRIEQVYDYLKNDMRVIYPAEDLITAKQTWPQYDLYYRTDTHWNGAGIYIASKALLAELGITMPDFGKLTVSSIPGGGMELARLSGRDLHDNYLALSGYTDRDAVLETDNKSYYRFHTEGADPRKVMIYGDSFGLLFSDGISTQFNDVYAIYRGYEEADLLGREKPDVVIYEVLERFLDTLMVYPLIP